MMNESLAMSRRAFFGLGAAAAVAGAACAGCAPSASPVAEELSDTGAQDAWLGEEPPIADEDVVEVIETDVLVCGAGTSGLFAACAAAENGARVVCLEKGSIGGGVRDNLGSLNSRLQREAGCEIDENEICNDLMRYATGYVNPKLYHIWAQNSGEAVDWYQDRVEEAGFQLFFEAANNATPTYFKHWATGHIPSWPADAESSGLTDVVNGKIVLGDYATSQGVEFLFSTPMVKLVVEDGAVKGAFAKGPEGYVKVLASKGTVVCTGGYAHNEEMLEALQPQTMRKYAANIAVPGTTGDGIKACLWAGARMDDVHTAMVFDRVAIKPDQVQSYDAQGELFWMGSNPWLKVNLNGERFINESSPYDYVLNAALSQPHNTFVNIWDSDYERYIEQFDVHGCARFLPFENGAPTNITLETVIGMNEALLEDGFIVKADTIEELAEGLGIPAENLKKTVERQNENYDNQVDPDFGKEAFRLSPIRKAPFYGVRTSGYMLCTLDGITINEQFQALNEACEPIEGLYVAGVDSGSYYAGTYPNMSTGNCCGRSITFARMIGKALAAK
ncbi:FAD-binding protein [Adlercreutzia sp. R21]|uniref:FAD-binding protein n=1 Tax=Adlercreutzia wanghongyangiae TaxID=3111451 RepID=A0ABU6IJG3_9ACTN|nr:FAD-binding protein [Adlercreutzia sp. R21]MEC4176607.1 FAD-binding protein [Adlercreutzia sp. R7]MEC4184940.1 FAD-binding protein [Adlercreutzia sp. R21]